MIHFFCEGHEVTRQCLGIKFLTGLFLIDRRGSPTVDASVISVLISDLMYEVQRITSLYIQISRVRVPLRTPISVWTACSEHRTLCSRW